MAQRHKTIRARKPKMEYTGRDLSSVYDGPNGPDVYAHGGKPRRKHHVGRAAGGRSKARGDRPRMTAGAESGPGRLEKSHHIIIIHGAPPDEALHRAAGGRVGYQAGGVVSSLLRGLMGAAVPEEAEVSELLGHAAGAATRGVARKISRDAHCKEHPGSDACDYDDE